MLTVAMQDCVNAVAGLTELAKLPFPLAFGVRVARLRFAVQLHVDRLNEAHRALNLVACDREDGQPVVERNERGQLAYRMSATAQYDVEMQYLAALQECVDVDAQPLTVAEIPATLLNVPTTLPPEILVALGPFLLG